MDRQDHCPPTMEASETTDPGNLKSKNTADDVFHAVEDDPEGSEDLDPRIQVSQEFMICKFKIFSKCNANKCLLQYALHSFIEMDLSRPKVIIELAI